ncbi:hypothetical protein QUC31_007111 [Theobroma cacao]
MQSMKQKVWEKAVETASPPLPLSIKEWKMIGSSIIQKKEAKLPNRNRGCFRWCKE